MHRQKSSLALPGSDRIAGWKTFLQILERGFLWLALQMDQVILLLVISEGHIIRYLCRRQHGLELSAA